MMALEPVVGIDRRIIPIWAFLGTNDDEASRVPAIAYTGTVESVNNHRYSI